MLSFREKAAIAFATAAPVDGYTLTVGDAADEAQKLADACCTRWGHEKLYNHALECDLCERCGAPLDRDYKQPLRPLRIQPGVSQ